MATIHSPKSPVAVCRHCHVQQQFHSDNGIPHAKERDHPFEAMRLSDFDIGDLDCEQLVTLIATHPEGETAPHRAELRSKVQKLTGCDWEDLLWSLKS